MVWIKKSSGSGRRPIILMNIQDRIVQKAASLVLRPMLDPLFDPLSFAFRPRRKREEAIALARQLALGGNPIWIPHDLKDAFGRVPVSRLLDICYKFLPCQKLRKFLERVLPHQSPKLRGIKQGSPLSPIALELYLTHFLHTPWRKKGNPVRILRYADDILLVASNRKQAEAADGELRKLLTPAGVLLKDSYPEAVRDLRKESAEWLGFQFQMECPSFQIRFGKRAFEKLAQRFLLAHAKSLSSQRVIQVLKCWMSQMGPCVKWEDFPMVFEKVIGMAHAYRVEELKRDVNWIGLWETAGQRWEATWRSVQKRSQYLTAGPVSFPTPTSVVW